MAELTHKQWDRVISSFRLLMLELQATEDYSPEEYGEDSVILNQLIDIRFNQKMKERG